MIDEKACAWLMDNAEAPIRYRVARELLEDGQAARKLEGALLEHPAVALWLAHLRPKTPPQHANMPHGSFDFNLENALTKAARLGLHGGLPQVAGAAGFYVREMEKVFTQRPFRNKFTGFNGALTANCLLMAGIQTDAVRACALGNLDELAVFAEQKDYDIYLSPEERAKLTGVPACWTDCTHFIRPELVDKRGFCYPLIYDLLGLFALYALGDAEVNRKIDTVLAYITCDEFHEKIIEGYGILVAGKRTYHGMGWDPKYPGWFDVLEYFRNGNIPKLLFFADIISHYPQARKTKWFADLLAQLDAYRTGADTHEFPKEWLPEKTGYAALGHHMSYGENRRKQNWREIESTFYVQSLRAHAT